MAPWKLRGDGIVLGFPEARQGLSAGTDRPEAMFPVANAPDSTTRPRSHVRTDQPLPNDRGAVRLVAISGFVCFLIGYHAPNYAIRDVGTPDCA